MFIFSFQKYFYELNLYVIYFKHQFKNFYPKLIFIFYYIYRHYSYHIFLNHDEINFLVIVFNYIKISLIFPYLVNL